MTTKWIFSQVFILGYYKGKKWRLPSFQRWSLLKDFAMPLNYVMQIMFSWHPHRNNHGRTDNANSMESVAISCMFSGILFHLCCRAFGVFSTAAFSGMSKKSTARGGLLASEVWWVCKGLAALVGRTGDDHVKQFSSICALYSDPQVTTKDNVL